jgi:glycosyltransferase involved in cell wall biosynthesis
MAGFDTVFISTSTSISESDLKKLVGYCIRIISRENRGYDFYSWKVGLDQYPHYQEHAGLLLANDSVHGPLFDFGDIIARLESCDADIVGMTDNFRYYPHLQSYFIYCKRPVVLSKEFVNFFSHVKTIQLKSAVIRKYEVGFAQILGKQFRLAALYPLEDILDQTTYLERPKSEIDPTFRLWKPLITKFKFPFLKRSLLTRRGVSIHEVTSVLAQSDSDFDVNILDGFVAESDAVTTEVPPINSLAGSNMKPIFWKTKNRGGDQMKIHSESDDEPSNNMTHVKLSICIATYSREKFIGETLDSILCQMTPDIELIVVDGASPDNTSEVMSQYLSRYPKIRYFREPVNSGIDADYDKAVGYASGDYCWLMTDDDLLKPDAISRIVGLVNDNLDLIIVNSEVRSADFSTVLRKRSLHFEDDREYGAEDGERFFSEIANYLSFIGCVVIRRDLWLARNRTFYYGTLFVHVGVIFQHHAITKALIIADPLITIRYGNAMWSARGFEIWLYKWPRLIWSFSDFSDRSKSLVRPSKPWGRLDKLILYRAMGAYTRVEYRDMFSNEGYELSKAMPFMIAIFPISLANTLASIYCLLGHRKASITIYDLARSQHATWISRSVARILGA